MNTKAYGLNNRLANNFEELRFEVDFGLSLTSLMEESITQQSSPAKAQLSRVGSNKQKHEESTSTSTITTSSDNLSEARPCLMTQKGTEITIIVNHDTDTNLFADFSYNLHHGVLFVATYNILEVGTNVNIRMVFPEKQMFILHGTVAWVQEPDNGAEEVSPGMGITFKKLYHESSCTMRQFMAEGPPLLIEVA